MSGDRFYDDLLLSAIYDAWHPRKVRNDFDFYIPRIMRAASVLDVGCGTGTLLNEAREAGHLGQLYGIDPGTGVLSLARKYSEIEWVWGELPQADWQNKFELVVMMGHAFQAIISDNALANFLSSVCECLMPNGIFAFETRNPLARAWERWTPEYPSVVRLQDGIFVEIITEITSNFDGQTVSFRHDFLGAHPSLPMSSESTLRFLHVEELAALLRQHGFVVEHQYGDFDSRALTDESPEIITTGKAALGDDRKGADAAPALPSVLSGKNGRFRAVSETRRMTDINVVCGKSGFGENGHQAVGPLLGFSLASANGRNGAGSEHC